MRLKISIYTLPLMVLLLWPLIDSGSTDGYDPTCRCPYNVHSYDQYCGRELIQMNAIADQKVVTKTCSKNQIYLCSKANFQAKRLQKCIPGSKCTPGSQYLAKKFESEEYSRDFERFCVIETGKLYFVKMLN